jgi:hypothetical protein
MRLREEIVLRQTDIDGASEFMGFGRGDDFLKCLAGHRELVRDTFEKFLR